MISVIVPTISGREDSLARCLASYEDTMVGLERELIVVKDEPNWPVACNEGYRQSQGDVLHFTADDLEALPGWHERALQALKEHDELPAPRVYDYAPDGRWANEEDGADGALTHFTRIPLLTRDQYERIGTWPEQLDYYADLWLSEAGRNIGIRTRMVHGYDFVHHWSQVGRIDTKERMDAAGWALNRLREEMV